MNRTIVLVVTGIVILMVLSGTFFTVDQTEQAVVVQFGRPVRSITEPGLYVKLPFVQDTRIFKKWILEWDGIPKSLTTLDKVSIYIDAVSRWRISDPLLFLQSVEGSELIAQSRLDNFIEGAVKDFIADNTLLELVRSSNRTMAITNVDEEGNEVRTDLKAFITEVGREEITRMILERAKNDAASLGIELVDVRIQGVNYVESVRRRVYDRMIAERMQMAAKFRSLGEGEKSRILGDKEIEMKTIISGAQKRALEIMGDGDAQATKIYAEAYGRDPEFYSFTKTLDAYRKSLEKNTTMILGTDSEFLKYLKSNSGR